MNAFARKFLWVLDVVDCGGAETVVAWAKRTGYALAVKWHDGDPADDAKWGFQKGFRDVLALAGPAGVPVLAWGYCYGDKYGNLLKEAQAVQDAFQAGAAGYIIDAETEWEVPQGREWAKRFIDTVKSKRPEIPLAYCPFWNMRWHSRYPAKEFSAGCEAVLPQVYFALGQKVERSSREEMVRIAREDFEPYGRPVFPVGEFCGMQNDGKKTWTAQEVDGTLDFLRMVGADNPHSLWLLDGQAPEMDYRGINLTILEALEYVRKSQPAYANVDKVIDDIESSLRALRGMIYSK